ncbi:MAG: elongation factor P [Spirochaetae bacterium HGW-Spirochaetae-7]|nr:MAG: elongation factor P [Spirochaetae bacterium HGW-Spirochaetae-7]
MLTTSQLRVGSIFMVGKDVLVVQRMLGNKGGRGGMVTKLRVKNLLTGGTSDLGLDSGEKFEEVSMDMHKMKLSYIDGETFVFLDQESFEQYELSKEDLGDNAGYITPDDDFDVEITFYEGKPVGIVLPIAIDRTITYCEPGIKGDTSGKSTKPATLDSGYTVQVPLFCEIGTKIKFDTRDGSFIERVK